MARTWSWSPKIIPRTYNLVWLMSIYSANLTNDGHFSFTYGYNRGRMKVPAGLGSGWPLLWGRIVGP